MNYLNRGLHRTLNSIQKKKRLFIVIVLLQLIFVVSSLWLGTHYVLRLLTDAQGVITPLEQANYNSQTIEQGTPFTPDFLPIYNSYQSMLKNVIAFASWMAVLFLILNGSIWILSHNLFAEKKERKLDLKRNLPEKAKEALQYFLKSWSAAIILFTPFAVASYYILIHYIRLSDSFATVLFMLKIVLLVKAGLYYFLLVAFATATELSWKKFASKIIQLSIFNFPKTFSLFVINAILLGSSFGALYAAVEYTESIMLLLLTGLLIIITIVLTRLFWIATLNEIERGTKI